jgi:CheY-like chemotaxis protein
LWISDVRGRSCCGDSAGLGGPSGPSGPAESKGRSPRSGVFAFLELAARLVEQVVQPLFLAALAVERLLDMMPPKEGAGLLIVEDDEKLARVFSESLAGKGYQVRTAATFAAAQAEIEHAPPDAAVIDVNLPDGNGAELAYELCTKAGIPVVMITGYDHDGVAELVHSMLPNTTRFLSKPFETSALLGALRSLSSRESGDS